MKKCFVITMMFAAQIAVSKDYGKSFEMQKLVSIADAITHYETYKGKEIVTKVKVEKVCQKKGCWMIVKDKSSELRVTFLDYGFFVSNDLLGKSVFLKGEIVAKKVSVEEQKHFLKDEGASPTEIAKVKKPAMKFRFVASGVKS